jgi:Flp pilus assembly protein TadB
MISDSEQKRLQEIEALLVGEDPKLARRFAAAGSDSGVRRRRVIAVSVAVISVVGLVIALVIPSVPLAVATLCGIGASGMVWTWHPAARVTADEIAVTDNPLIDPPTLN